MPDIENTTPIEVVVKRYQCPACRYRRATKKLVAEHMARCWYRPANRTCKTCAHFSIDRADYETGAPEVIWCGAKSVELDYLQIPVVGCPLWRDRDLEEDEPEMDEWDASLRDLIEGGESE